MTNPADKLDAHEAAALHAAGALSPAEESEFLSKVLGGDAEYSRAFDEFASVRESLAQHVQPAQPPANLRSVLLQRVQADAATRPKDHAEDPERLVIVRAPEVDWQESGVPGVQCRKLFADPATNRMTILFRMAPGTVFPDHEHGGVEECYVLDGDLSIAGTVLRRNDYIRVPAGARHGEPRTTGGALLLITCPLMGEAA